MLLFISALSCLGQSEIRTEAKHLYDSQQWDELIARLEPVHDRSGELDFYLGVALAQRGRFEEGRSTLLQAHRLSPEDLRPMVELGGIAFKQNRTGEATDWLLKAERLNPSDAYVNDFLGTLFYLRGNLESALKYWNRVGKPYIENVRVEPALQLDPVLLDSAFAFSQASVMTLPEFLTTHARLTALGLLPGANIELVARPDGKFDAVLHSTEKRGFGKNWWTALVATFVGAPFYTVTPEYYSIDDSGTNAIAMGRFHPERRRFTADFSGPIRRSAKWRWSILGDYRNENWNVRNFEGPGLVGSLNMRRSAVAAEVAAISSAKFAWVTGVEYSRRDYRSVTPGFSPDLLLEGNQLKHTAELTFDLLRVPQQRYDAAATIQTQTGRIWSADPKLFFKFQATLNQAWAPGDTGDNWLMLHRVAFARTAGDLPFDELFMLGMDRDGEYNMRGHSAIDSGRKGYAPLGRNYFVSNWELDKAVYGNGLFRLKLGPFIDTGRITDPLPYLGSNKWLLDVGPQARVRAFGVQMVMSYGRDLRRGEGTFFIYVGR